MHDLTVIFLKKNRGPRVFSKKIEWTSFRLLISVIWSIYMNKMSGFFLSSPPPAPESGLSVEADLAMHDGMFDERLAAELAGTIGYTTVLRAPIIGYHPCIRFVGSVFHQWRQFTRHTSIIDDDNTRCVEKQWFIVRAVLWWMSWSSSASFRQIWETPLQVFLAPHANLARY